MSFAIMTSWATVESLHETDIFLFWRKSSNSLLSVLRHHSYGANVPAGINRRERFGNVYAWGGK